MEWKKVTELFSWHRGGLRRRLLSIGLFFLALALLTTTFASYLYTRSQIKRDAAQLQTEVASRISHEIAEFVRRKVERLQDLLATASLYELDSQELRLLLLILLKNDASFTEVAVLDQTGMEVLKVSERKVYLPSELSDYSAEEKFREAFGGGTYISPVYTSDKAEPYVTLAVPIKVTPKLVVGVVTAELNLRFLWRIIGDIEFGGAGYAYLVDSQGNLIAHRDPSLVLKRTNLSHIQQVREFLQNPRDLPPAFEGQGIVGRPVLSTFASVGRLGWVVVLEEPVAVAFGEINRLRRYAFLILGLGVLGGAFLIVWASNKITKPIRELHRGAEVIGKGNLEHRVVIKTGDEIEELAEEFNKMAGELKTSYATLEDKVERRTSELSALYDVTTIVNQSLELEPVLQEVIKKITGIFHFDATRVFLFDSQMEELHLQASFETHPEFWAQVRTFRRGQGVVGKVAETGEPLIFENIDSDPRYQELSHSKATKKGGFSFFAVFPIRTKRRCVGTIVSIGRSPRNLTIDEIQLITSMTGQIGVAVENSNLFQETVTKSIGLSALYDVTSAVNQSLKLTPILEEVIKKITGIFHFDATRVFLFDSQMEELHLQASFETKPEFNAHVRVFKRGQGNIGKAAETGEPLIFEDINSDPRYRESSHTKATQKAGFSFLAAFPIKTKTGTVGTLLCIGRMPRRLTPDELRLIVSMADQIGVAVENANLFQETVTKTKELSALYDVTATVNQSMELDVVVKEVIHKVLEVVHFDAAWIYLLDPEGKELRLKAYEGISPEFASRTATDPVGVGINGNVVATGKSAIFEDIQTDPEYTKLAGGRLAQEAGFRAYISLPLKTKTKTLGVMNFLSYQSRRFLPNEVALLTSMANQIGVAIENTSFYEGTVKRAHQLSTLNALSATVSQSLELDLILEKATEKLLEVLRFDAARIFLLDREGKELQLKSHKGVSGELAQVPPYQVGEGIIGKVIQSGEMMIFDDIQTDPRFHQLARRGAAIEAGFHAHVCFPLKVKGKVRGVANLFSCNVHHFTPEELQMLASMANQIGVAIENTSLYEETVKRAQQLSALYTVTAAVSQSLDLEPVLQGAVKKITGTFDFDATRIFLFNAQMDELCLRASSEILPESFAQAEPFRRGQGINGKVAETGEPLIFEDLLSDPRYQELSRVKLAQRAGFSFFAVFPIKSKLRTVGTIACFGQMPRHLTGDEIQLMTSMADQIGVAVENTGLFEEVRRKSQELAALVKINRDIAALLDRKTLLAHIAEEAKRILKMDSSNFRLIEGEYLVAVSSSHPENIRFRQRLRLDESLSGYVVKENRVVALRNVVEDPTIIEEHREMLRKTGYHAYLGIPLQIGNLVIGAVNLLSHEERDFSQEEISLITAFADQAAIAIQNANLFAAINQKSLELEKANRDLQEANRAKADFLAAMSHELRTPLNVIVGNADLLKDGVFGDINEKQRDALEKVLHQSGTLLKLINDVLTLTKAEAKKMALNLSTFHVNEIITHAQSYVEQLNRNGHLKILWEVEPNLPPITTDALKLEEILQNLIGNAFKFTPEGKIEVRVRDLQRKGRIEFTVADTGIGIDKGNLDKIFDQFHQLKEAHTGTYTGVGLGLNIVKRYLELMRGDIRVKSQPRIGSTFTFTLPYSI